MERGLVVGAALVRDGCVLAARRTSPPEVAGRWELPGGKVEPGETPEAALVRELGEELGCRVEVESWLDGRTPVGDRLELAVGVVLLVEGEPVASEHDRLRWLTPDELDDVDWLGSDRPFLAAIAARLHRALRGVLLDEDDARAVARLLVDAGHTAELARERLAGEDDDEDHPWVVTTDAPGDVLGPLLEAHDGWPDDIWPDDGWPDDAGPEAEPLPGRPPPPLPRAPRRLPHERRGGAL